MASLRRLLEALQIAAPYEIGWPTSVNVGSFGALYPIYVRGLAYLAAKQGAEAAAEFQKILSHSGIVYYDPVLGAVARLQLGTSVRSGGRPDQGEGAYQDFLTVWKDADPDIPILKQARAEVLKL